MPGQLLSATAAQLLARRQPLTQPVPAGLPHPTFAGVLVLFGLMPAAMAWSERYSEPPTTLSRVQALPGGKLSLLAVGGAAGLVIARELLLAGQG